MADNDDGTMNAKRSDELTENKTSDASSDSDSSVINYSNYNSDENDKVSNNEKDDAHDCQDSSQQDYTSDCSVKEEKEKKCKKKKKEKSRSRKIAGRKKSKKKGNSDSDSSKEDDFENYSFPSKSKSIDFDSVSKSMIDKLDRLDDLLVLTKTPQDEELQNLKKETQDVIKMLNNKLQYIKKIGDNFDKKDVLISTFCKSCYKISGLYPSTKGPYDRKYMESPRALSDLFEHPKFGNPIGSRIVFIFGAYDFNLDKYIELMYKLKSTTRKSPEKRLTFGVFRLDKIYEVNSVTRSKKDTKKMPHFEMIMTDLTNNKSIICECAPTQTRKDMSNIETLDISGKNIFEALPEMVNRKLTITNNLTKRIEKLDTVLPRNKRVKILDAILIVMSQTLQFLKEGYKYIDVGDNMMVAFSTEREKICHFSGVNAPYMLIHLKCGHKLSIMAMYGIVHTRHSDDSESIKCPLCRENLIPKLVPTFSSDEEKESCAVKIYTKDDIADEVDNSKFDFEDMIDLDGTDSSDDKKSSNNNKENNKEIDEYIDSLFTRKSSTNNGQEEDESEEENQNSDSDYGEDTDDEDAPNDGHYAAFTLMNFLGGQGRG